MLGYVTHKAMTYPNIFNVRKGVNNPQFNWETIIAFSYINPHGRGENLRLSRGVLYMLYIFSKYSRAA